MQYDLHVHTKYSFDSKAEMAGYCKYAEKLGLRAICFTEHYDCDPDAEERFFFRSDLYFSELERVREEYKGRLQILSGVEISEPHLYPQHMERLQKMPFDILMGSVHIWDQYHPRIIHWPEKDHLEEKYKIYWEQVWHAVEAGGFHCFAHLDFPKRHCGQLIFEEDVMRDIFLEMKKKGIVPEINTSLLRRGGTETMPGKELLKIYAVCGGESITTGSDAHREEDLGNGIEKAAGLAEQFGLRQELFGKI